MLASAPPALRTRALRNALPKRTFTSATRALRSDKDKDPLAPPPGERLNRYS